MQQRLDNLRLSLEVTSDREEHARKELRIARLNEEIAAHMDALLGWTSDAPITGRRPLSSRAWGRSQT